MVQLSVDLGARSYPIIINIDDGLTDAAIEQVLSPYLNNPNVVIVSNATVAGLYLEVVKSYLGDKSIETFLMPDGEAYKSLATFDQLNSFLLSRSYGRDTTLIALGGGVVGDLTGFVAACYQRGIDFIQIPTTLLSQVDSSVGGKTAINHPLGKNMIGAFYQPKAVLINVASLASLPAREFAAGLAEVIKYGVANDGELFNFLDENRQAIKALSRPVMAEVIRRCCQIKADVVAQDEKEAGLRALLNFGHTFGHAIEAHMGYGVWLHGEAVAAGMVYASRVAQQQGLLTAAEVNRIIDLIDYFDLPVDGPTTMGYDDYMPHMRKDKKTQAGTIRFIIPTGIGSAKVTSQVSEQVLRQVLGDNNLQITE